MLDQVSSCQWLFLSELGDGPGNSLRVLVEEGRSQDTVEDIEVGGVKIAGVRAIKHDDSCRAYELVWSSYICYAVRNESYASGDGTDWKGQRVRRHDQSAFLNYVAKDTFASSDYPGPFTHIEIVCENHVLGVASIVEPVIKLVKPGRPREMPSPNKSLERTREG
jgi:hypothetical protein